MIDPTKHTDFMAYCQLAWVSKYRYDGIRNHFRVGGTALVVEPEAIVPGQFWLVSGALEDGGVTLDPLFQFESTASTGEGSGDYHIEVRDSAGATRFIRGFDAAFAHAWPDETAPRFSQMVPVDDTAASIAIVDPAGADIGVIELTGVAPSVEVTFPTRDEVLAGVHAVTWEVSDPDSASHTFWVKYSADDGATWGTLASDIDESHLALNFGNMPGCATGASCRFRVVASDGVNTGVAESDSFTVLRKPPDARIAFPATDTAFPQLGQLVWLQGYVFDPDDGYLDDNVVSWASDVDGFLGNGSDLPVYDLSEGRHEITMTATDSDGNVAADSIVIAVGVGGPLCNGITANVVGTPGPDVLFGTVGNDSIVALEGDDVIFGLGGDDTVCAGAGNDQVWTTWGTDWVSGDQGDDIIRTGGGDDKADGGPGRASARTRRQTKLDDSPIIKIVRRLNRSAITPPNTESPNIGSMAIAFTAVA